MKKGNTRKERLRGGVSAVEPTLFVGLALLYIWVLQPTHNDWLRVPVLAVIVLIPLASAILHGDSLRDLGLQIGSFGASAREVGLATVGGAVVILVIGLLALSRLAGGAMAQERAPLPTQMVSSPQMETRISGGTP